MQRQMPKEYAWGELASIYAVAAAAQMDWSDDVLFLIRREAQLAPASGLVVDESLALEAGWEAGREAMPLASGSGLVSRELRQIAFGLSGEKLIEALMSDTGDLEETGARLRLIAAALQIALVAEPVEASALRRRFPALEESSAIALEAVSLLIQPVVGQQEG